MLRCLILSCTWSHALDATLLDLLLHLKHALDATLLDLLLHLKHALDATLLDLLVHLKHALDATLLDPLLHLKHALDATLLGLLLHLKHALETCTWCYAAWSSVALETCTWRYAAWSSLALETCAWFYAAWYHWENALGERRFESQFSFLIFKKHCKYRDLLLTVIRRRLKKNRKTLARKTIRRVYAPSCLVESNGAGRWNTLCTIYFIYQVFLNVCLYVFIIVYNPVEQFWWCSICRRVSWHVFKPWLML